MSETGYKTITIHILPRISQSKGNQTVKFDQLIEYNKRKGDQFQTTFCFL